MHAKEKLPVVREGTQLSAAIVEMTAKGFGVTAVVDLSDRLTGILTDGDLRRTFRQAFADRAVEAAMTRNPWTISPEALAPEVLYQMNTRGVTSVFILDEEGRPKGILHIHDILRSGVG